MEAEEWTEGSAAELLVVADPAWETLPETLPDVYKRQEYQRRRVIGHLFQDPLKGTAPNMTIEENLALAYPVSYTHLIAAAFGVFWFGLTVWLMRNKLNLE